MSIMNITENEHPLSKANPALLAALKKQESESFIEFLVEVKERKQIISSYAFQATQHIPASLRDLL